MSCTERKYDGGKAPSVPSRSSDDGRVNHCYSQQDWAHPLDGGPALGRPVPSARVEVLLTGTATHDIMPATDPPSKMAPASVRIICLISSCLAIVTLGAIYALPVWYDRLSVRRRSTLLHRDPFLSLLSFEWSLIPTAWPSGALLWKVPRQRRCTAAVGFVGMWFLTPHAACPVHGRLLKLKINLDLNQKQMNLLGAMNYIPGGFTMLLAPLLLDTVGPLYALIAAITSDLSGYVVLWLANRGTISNTVAVISAGMVLVRASTGESFIPPPTPVCYLPHVAERGPVHAAAGLPCPGGLCTSPPPSHHCGACRIAKTSGHRSSCAPYRPCHLASTGVFFPFVIGNLQMMYGKHNNLWVCAMISSSFALGGLV